MGPYLRRALVRDRVLFETLRYMYQHNYTQVHVHAHVMSCKYMYMYMYVHADTDLINPGTVITVYINR